MPAAPLAPAPLAPPPPGDEARPEPATALNGAGPGAPALDKRPEAIRGMFARVAPVYDLLNHLLSGSLDHVWRRRAARAVRPDARASAGSPILDLCCGTGDQAIALWKRGASVAAADFCLPMVAIARRKLARRHGAARRPAPMVADALALPFPAASFAAATVSFGLRNVVDLDGALREIVRVLAPGGQLAVLEFALPRLRPLRALYLFYFQKLLPRVGRLVSRDPAAYTYLPSSVVQFPQREGFLTRMEHAGFSTGAWQDLAAGIVCLYTARKAT